MLMTGRIWGSTGLALLTLAASWAIAPAAIAQDSQKGVTVTVVKATRVCFAATAEVYGIILPREEATVSPPRDGLRVTALLVEPGPGFAVSRELEKMGLHTSNTVELSFDGVAVPADGLLGARGQGLKIALETLDGGRVSVAAQACGIAQAALDVAVGYASERVAFGGPIARFQGVQFPIADVAARLHAARLATLHAARLRDAGRPHGTEGAMAKLLASAVAVEAADVAVQTLGGYGYSTEYPAERLYRDAKITEIYEGTSQIQRIVIARSLFGKTITGSPER